MRCHGVDFTVSFRKDVSVVQGKYSSKNDQPQM